MGKHAYLRQLVAQQSARTLAGYVYCSAGFGESSTDLVFAGNGIVAENGRILRESGRFRLEEQLVVADIDIQRLEFERRRNTSFRMHEGAAENTVIEMEVPEGLRAAALDRDIDPMPFVPRTKRTGSERCEEIFQIQSHGLAKRLVHTRCEKAVIGISADWIRRWPCSSRSARRQAGTRPRRNHRHHHARLAAPRTAPTTTRWN